MEDIKIKKTGQTLKMETQGRLKRETQTEQNMEKQGDRN